MFFVVFRVPPYIVLHLSMDSEQSLVIVLPIVIYIYIIIYVGLLYVSTLPQINNSTFCGLWFQPLKQILLRRHHRGSGNNPAALDFFGTLDALGIIILYHPKLER